MELTKEQKTNIKMYQRRRDEAIRKLQEKFNVMEYLDIEKMAVPIGNKEQPLIIYSDRPVLRVVPKPSGIVAPDGKEINKTGGNKA